VGLEVDTMPKENSIKIGIITIQNAPWIKLVERWRFIDSTEFDSLWVADHFTHWNKKRMTFFECWTTLCGMACETSRIRIGTAVINMHWRHPAWLAKQALTVDHMSNGRLDLGLGAGGSSDLEHSMTGIEKWSPRERVERFKEYVQIVDLLLRNPSTNYEGEYYELEEAIMQPDPFQKPRPPIFIGANGPKMLKITAEFADAWNVLGDITTMEKTIERMEEKNSLLDECCNEVGRDPGTIRRTLGVYESEAMHHIGNMKLYENLEIFDDAVKELYKIGFTEFFVPYPFKEEEISNFEYFSKEMLPELKKRYS
jgi:alkanesulfonate monooxygenase SsuD/methylene tetrahydromethanopterin reductase-like flavin-dependent oxidoreductase (luciferase family)